MLICSECGHVFEECEARTVEERVGDKWSDITRYAVCPICGETPVVAEQCSICGEYKCASDLTSDVCDECGSKLLARFREVWNGFSEAEQAYIVDQFTFEY